MINRAKFYKVYREEFENTLKTATVDSINAILNVFDSSDETVCPLEKFAYMLATVRHEVGSDMIPIVENLNYTSAKRIMQVWPSRFPTLASAKPYVKAPRELGNKVYGLRLGNGLLEGFKYRGRGIGAQLTGYDNYVKFGKLLNIDLTKEPDLALDVKVGAQILYRGSIQGLFTGKRLSHYIKPNDIDFVNARSVINADVSANGEKIARDANKFLKILKQASL